MRKVLSFSGFLMLGLVVSQFPVSYTHLDVYKRQIQKHLEECGFEDVGGDFTYIPNDLKEVTPEQRETLDKICLLYTSRCV